MEYALIRKIPILLSLVLTCISAEVAGAPPSDAKLEREPNGELVAHWTSATPMDVFVSGRSDASPRSAALVSSGDADGRAPIPADGKRTYVMLRDPRSGQFVRIAERLVPLDQGSNFRDIGGYAMAGGRHVRWGLIYRSGATPLLSDRDREQIHGLRLVDMIDLRSDEERVLAPSRIDGVRYAAVGYSMAALNFTGDTVAGYRQMPLSLRPQLRLLFATLLRGEGPLVYNCSAGQDRTGLATALILSALGVPRDTILADYHLSTRYRQPQNEMPPISSAMADSNSVAGMFAKYQQQPGRPQVAPLMTADGKAYLSFALEVIDRRWGSVDAYLKAELGIGPKEIARLRELYTE